MTLISTAFSMLLLLSALVCCAMEGIAEIKNRLINNILILDIREMLGRLTCNIGNEFVFTEKTQA